ncbi:MAG: M23 family metallopeptidase, partial [Thermoanaerobaculum sp.]|nr:M23 family metallopeptidase [Thermoanaerobaculum sp.]
LRGLYTVFQVMGAKREQQELVRLARVLKEQEGRTLERLQVASQELRRLALITGFDLSLEGEEQALQYPQVWAQRLVEEADALWAWAQKQARLFATLPAICPLEQGKFVVSSRFGPRVSPFTGTMEWHKGLDLAAPEGLPVWATGEGIVVFAGRVGTENPLWARLGNVVVLAHGESYYTVYAHLAEVRVRQGQKVERRGVVGTVGSTGWSTAPHLHYEVRRQVGSELVPVDPAFFLLDFPMPAEHLAMGGAAGVPLDLLADVRVVWPWQRNTRSRR